MGRGRIPAVVQATGQRTVPMAEERNRSETADSAANEVAA